MKRNLRFDRIYPHPPEKVWRAITHPKAMAQWLMANDFKAEVGQKFQFHTEPRPGFDGIIHCEVLEVDPPRRLVYSWRGGWQPGKTTVIWTLEPVAGGTRLTFEHNDFEGFKGIILSYILGAGWKPMLEQKLGDIIANIDQIAPVEESA